MSDLILELAFKACINPLFFDGEEEQIVKAKSYSKKNQYNDLAKYFDNNFTDLIIQALEKGYKLEQICDKAFRALFREYLRKKEIRGAMCDVSA